jgi:hypothetical protein
MNDEYSDDSDCEMPDEEILISNKENYEKLQNEVDKKSFDDELENLIQCPDCGIDDYVSNLVNGLYRGKESKFFNKTKIRICMGCCVPQGHPKFMCRKCNKYFTYPEL